MILPEKFVQRMKNDLGEEACSFLSVYDKPPYKGIRVNTLKISKEEFMRISPFALEQVEWEENGFIVDAEKVGSHPYHFAGAFYSQEPSAMSAAPLLEVKGGEKVLDLCSAPGGKGTQLAQNMCDEGIIVMNEYVQSRSKILAQNVERMGVRNAVVTNLSPEKLSEKFENYFDKILVDAPCSGEGMFRKEEAAISEWSQENVSMCAERQRGILAQAYKMLKKDGGRLVYSTCTFAKEEDEENVDWFLRTFPEMRLVKSEKLLPHKVKGEGHFVSLFECCGEGERSEIKTAKLSVSQNMKKAYSAFCKAFFKREGDFTNLYEVGDTLYSLPDEMFDMKGINVVKAGVKLGENVNGRFEPSHTLAMCLKPDDVKIAVNVDEEQAERYLKGETLTYESENGWCVVFIDGLPLGLGKSVNSQIKNHLPKGLRKVK